MINDASYDLLTVLQNKLEAVDAYERYLEDLDRASEFHGLEVIEEIKRDDERHIARLIDEIERLVREGKFRQGRSVPLGR